VSIITVLITGINSHKITNWPENEDSFSSSKPKIKIKITYTLNYIQVVKVACFSTNNPDFGSD
jgi:hypothetical protein